MPVLMRRPEMTLSGYGTDACLLDAVEVRNAREALIDCLRR